MVAGSNIMCRGLFSTSSSRASLDIDLHRKPFIKTISSPALKPARSAHDPGVFLSTNTLECASTLACLNLKPVSWTESSAMISTGTASGRASPDSIIRLRVAAAFLAEVRGLRSDRVLATERFVTAVLLVAVFTILSSSSSNASRKSSLLLTRVPKVTERGAETALSVIVGGSSKSGCSAYLPRVPRPVLVSSLRRTGTVLVDLADRTLLFDFVLRNSDWMRLAATSC
mmetsp:Transcript_51140/g.129065  ORF Transcript_51140/g.129065 Transcript_51140/m.129065 type:complete len:228 (-) Transcript_51140:3408-4091(-)